MGSGGGGWGGGSRAGVICLSRAWALVSPHWSGVGLYILTPLHMGPLHLDVLLRLGGSFAVHGYLQVSVFGLFNLFSACL